MRPTTGTVALLALLLTGCLAPGSDAPPVGAGPANAPATPDPTPVPLPVGWPEATLTVRDVTGAPGPAAQVEATMSLAAPAPGDALFEARATVGDTVTVMALPVVNGSRSASARLDLAGPAGPNDVRVALHRDGVDGPLAAMAVRVVFWAGVALQVNASEPYAAGQNVFVLAESVPFAPWDNESAHTVLLRAASTYGFSVDTPYDESLESYYVRMINGTEEAWLVPGVVSRSWMVLHNGALADRAADDVFPADGDMVEFRFVQCWSTGNCEGV